LGRILPSTGGGPKGENKRRQSGREKFWEVVNIRKGRACVID